MQRPTSNDAGRHSSFVIRHSSLGMITGVVLAVSMGSLPTFAQSNGVPGPQDYAGFSHFITDRNIFDPNRQPHYYSTNRPFVRRSRPNWTPGIQFVGTMSYTKGWFAFFSGNSADLSKVLQVGSKIADYTITEISANHVQLESADKKQLALSVGDGLRQENGKWVPGEAGELATSDNAPGTTTDSSSTSTESSSSAPPPSVSEPNDVLKRLMQLREKENQ